MFGFSKTLCADRLRWVVLVNRRLFETAGRSLFTSSQKQKVFVTVCAYLRCCSGNIHLARDYWLIAVHSLGTSKLELLRKTKVIFSSIIVCYICTSDVVYEARMVNNTCQQVVR